MRLVWDRGLGFLERFRGVGLERGGWTLNDYTCDAAAGNGAESDVVGVEARPRIFAAPSLCKEMCQRSDEVGHEMLDEFGVRCFLRSSSSPDGGRFLLAGGFGGSLLFLFVLLFFLLTGLGGGIDGGDDFWGNG